MKKITKELSIKDIDTLDPNEVAKIITRTLRFKPEFIKEILKVGYKEIPSLNFIIAKITMQAMTSDNVKDTIAATEWLMSRAIGKTESVTQMGTINQLDRKITYITTIDAHGNIQREEHYEQE